MLVKAKAKLENGKLKAKVKYPLVGGAELELGKISKLSALVKVPFLFKTKLLWIFGYEKNDKKKRNR